MRKAKKRWPGISNLQLIGVAFLWSYAFDFVMEGLILLPFGFYAYPGAIQAWSLNAGTHYQYPLYEGLMWGSVETAICCLRYFTDSRGRTIVERGLDDVGGGFVGQQMTRFLAIFAEVSASFFSSTWLPYSGSACTRILGRKTFRSGLTLLAASAAREPARCALTRYSQYRQRNPGTSTRTAASSCRRVLKCQRSCHSREAATDGI